MRESDVLSAICDYLALKKEFFYRNNNTPVYDPTRKTFRAMPKYALKGVPDIVLIKDGIYHGIEVKAPTGAISASQREFQTKLEEAGGKYHIVRSIDDLIESLYSNSKHS